LLGCHWTLAHGARPAARDRPRTLTGQLQAGLLRPRSPGSPQQCPRRGARMLALEQVMDMVDELADPQRCVSDLPGGLTNANYKVLTSSGAYVVRRWSDDTGLLAIDRDNEYENSVRAAEVGVGAGVVAYLPEHNTMV